MEPRQPVAATGPGGPGRGWRMLVAFLVVLVLFFQFGRRALNEPDEARYAEVAREMQESDDYLVPRLNGVRHLSKPPLTYWLMALNMEAFGVNEFAARLPAALAAAATCAAAYLMAASAWGVAGGLWSVVILLSCPLFFFVGRLCTTDMVLTACITWSVWAFWRWSISNRPRWRQIAWFYVFLGLGMITKGPVAVLLPVLAIGGLWWRHPELRTGRRLCWGWGLTLFFLIAAPWFVAVAGTDWHVWEYFIGREAVGRLVSTVHHRREPFWFFVPVLAAAVLPWLPWAVTAPWSLRGQDGRAAHLTRLCGAWALLGLLVFSVSRSKLATYIAPLCPPLAMLAAGSLQRLVQSADISGRARFLRGTGLASVGMGTIGLAVVLVVMPRRYPVPPTMVVTAAALLGTGLLLSLSWLLAGRPWRFAGAWAGTLLGSYLVLLHFLPTFERDLRHNTSAKFFAERIQRGDPSGRAIVLSYHTFLMGLPFYLGRPVLWYEPPVPKRPGEVGEVFEYRSDREPVPFLVHDETHLQDFVLGSGPAFFVVRNWDVEALAGRFEGALREVERAGGWVLLSNRPAREEGPSS